MAARRLGPYATLEELSSRAFTTTYRAEQPTLGRTVLLRALKPTVSPSSPFAQEIEREAAMLAKLNHPAIIRLFDFVRTEETAYLVLEDKRGVMLTELVGARGEARSATSERGRLGFDAAAAVTLEIARGLGHAHGRGIVVKDLRPAVVELGHDGGVRIVELASAYLPSMPSLPEPLEVGDSLARPDFMAPEQILGERMGPRSDVFAAGAMFHWLTTGAAPFAADDAKEVAHRVRNDAPAPIRICRDPTSGSSRFVWRRSRPTASPTGTRSRRRSRTRSPSARAFDGGAGDARPGGGQARRRARRSPGARARLRDDARGRPRRTFVSRRAADPAVRLRPRHRRRRRARGLARSGGRDDLGARPSPRLGRRRGRARLPPRRRDAVGRRLDRR